MSAADGGMSTYSQQVHQSSVFAWLANDFCGHTDGACREAQHGAKASKSSQACACVCMCVCVRERVQSISTHWTSPNVPVKLYLPQPACSIEHTASIREPFCNSTRRVFPRSTHAKLCTCLRRSQLTTSDRASLNWELLICPSCSNIGIAQFKGRLQNSAVTSPQEISRTGQLSNMNMKYNKYLNVLLYWPLSGLKEFPSTICYSQICCAMGWWHFDSPTGLQTPGCFSVWLYKLSTLNWCHFRFGTFRFGTFVQRHKRASTARRPSGGKESGKPSLAQRVWKCAKASPLLTHSKRKIETTTCDDFQNPSFQFLSKEV